METLSQAIEVLNNNRLQLIFGDDNLVHITEEDGTVVIEAEMDDVNDDQEVIEFVKHFIKS